jgi:hypothetical protein
MKIIDWHESDCSTRVGFHLCLSGKVKRLRLEWSLKRGSTQVGSALPENSRLE